jgi:predicted lipoprotein
MSLLEKRNNSKMKKYIHIAVIILLAGIALYHSVYFEKLDAKKSRDAMKHFYPKEKAIYFWENDLDELLTSAIDLKQFDSMLANDAGKLTSEHGKCVGITSSYCFLVRGAAKVTSPDSKEMPVELTDGHAEYTLQIKYIFSNAARDATGYFNIDDFENSGDFNALSTELNTLVLEREASKLDSLSEGETIKFIGALEVNTENSPKQIGIVPLKIEAVR